MPQPDPHFHKTDRISEIDIIPDPTVLGALPASAEEGKFTVIEDGSDFILYRFVKGTWVLIGPVTLGDISPLTIKGDLLTRDDSAHVRFGVGEDGQVLIADSAEAQGFRWTDFVVERLAKTVTVVGSFAVGDLIVKVPAATGVKLYRTVDSDSPGWGAGNTDFGTTTQEEYAIKFRAPFGFTLKSFKIYLEKNGTPADNVTCKLYNDSAGSPGTLITTSASTVAGGTIDPSNAAEYTFNFNDALTGGTDYWIPMDRSGSNDNSNYYQVQKSDGSDLTSGAIASLWPHYDSKLSSDPNVWGSSLTPLTFFTIIGDISESYQKWHGVRSNIVVEPIGIVTAVNGSSATVVMAGLATGLSGLTPGAIHTIGGCKVGQALSATELMVFPRKSFTYKELATDCDGTVYFPLGIRPLTATKDVTGTVNLDTTTTPGEVKISGGGNGTINFSDEYEAI